MLNAAKSFTFHTLYVPLIPAHTLMLLLELVHSNVPGKLFAGASVTIYYLLYTTHYILHSRV